MVSLPIRALNTILFVVELIAATFLFVRPFKRRKLWWVWLITGVCVLVGACFLFSWLKDVIMQFDVAGDFSFALFGISYVLAVIIEILLVVIYVLFLFAVFESDFLNLLYISCASYLTQNTARCLFVLFFILRDRSVSSVVSALSDPFNLMAYIFIYVVIYLLCWFLFGRKYENTVERGFVNKILIPLISIILINILMGSINMPKNNSEAEALFLFILISRICLSCTGLAVQFLIYNGYKMKLAQSMLQQIMIKQKEQYEVARDSIDNVNINAHDLKRQISIILKAIRDSGKNDAVENRLNEMMDSISVLDTNYNTGNKALDITLTEKSRTCLRKKIKLSTIADGNHLEFMSDIDIYALFGNALDNAIEATERIEDEDSRIISFSLRKENGVITLHVENTFEERPVFVNGLPQTIKRDKRSHGYGVKSMINIAKKYGGNLTVNVGNGMFYLDIILPMDNDG